MNFAFVQTKPCLRLFWLVNSAAVVLFLYLGWSIYSYSANSVERTPWQAPSADKRVVADARGSLQQYLKAAKVLSPPKKEVAVVKPKPIPSAALGSAASVLKLKGTVVDPQLSVAFVELKKLQRQQAIYVGDVIEGFTVTAIEAGLIRLSRGGKEVAPLRVTAVKTPLAAAVTQEKSSSLPGPEPVREVSKSDVQKLIKEPSILLRDLSFSPKLNAQGKIEGMQITRMVKNSIFDKRGIRVGDVVTNINGKNATGMGAAMALMADINEAEEFVIKVKRRGRPKTFRFKVK